MNNPDPPLFYLVNLRIDAEVADQWEAWMRTTHIPDVLDTGCFDRAWICRQPEDDGGARRAYRMIYIATSRSSFERYQSQFAPTLQADHTTRYEGQFDASRSLCNVIKELKK